ncbi:MAG TPA: hypothetical protein VL913_01470, partial [Candidatus Micrarchaeaceae archaeon]|nr:hypothetical protein [Candidatus Micrarchaeaceae archaeon]
MSFLPSRKSSLGISLLSAVALLSLVALSACGGGSSAPPSINITPTTASVPAPGGTADFTATVTNSSSGVKWEVNGVAGGNSTVGTIINDAQNPFQGDYSAPAAVPNSNPVMITAVLSSNSSVVSNAASLTLTAAQSLLISPSSTTVVPGVPKTFTATMNGNPDTNVTWTVSSAMGGNVGVIGGSSGTYNAPPFPPPGGQVVVKAVDNTNQATGTALVTIAYGNASLSGTYSFGYTGDDGSGFFTIAGSMALDGNGNVTGGVVDATDLNGVIFQATPITAGAGSVYLVGTNGLAQINFVVNGTTLILEAALTTNLHGLVINFDGNASGSGTIDQQTTADFGNVTGPYVFTTSGADGGFPAAPLALAGKFTANSGTIPNLNAIVDSNDGFIINGNDGPTEPDTSLSGSYAQDLNNTAFGRGTVSLTAGSFTTFSGATTITFAYYVVDRTHLRLVEIDNNSFMGGDVYKGLPGNNFSNSTLANGNNTFSFGGAASQGQPYTAAGVFASNGTGSVTGGAFSNNSGGTINKLLTVNNCAYTVDPATGRIDLLLGLKSGSGCAIGHSTDEFAYYQTALAEPSAVAVEIDQNFIASGVAYAQSGSPVAPSGTFAFNLTGVGTSKSTTGQQDAVGQFLVSGTTVPSGTININNVGALQSGPIVSNQSNFSALAGSFGAGTAKVSVNLTSGGSGTAVYNLGYFYVDPSTYVLIDLDTTRV